MLDIFESTKLDPVVYLRYKALLLPYLVNILHIPAGEVPAIDCVANGVIVIPLATPHIQNSIVKEAPAAKSPILAGQDILSVLPFKKQLHPFGLNGLRNVLLGAPKVLTLALYELLSSNLYILIFLCIYRYCGLVWRFPPHGVPPPV